MHNAAQQNNAHAVALLPAADFALEQAPAYDHEGGIREGWFRERNALWNLLRWMEYQGFSLGRVFDGEQWESVDSLEQALAVCSSVDESILAYVQVLFPGHSTSFQLQTMFGEGVEGVVFDHTMNSDAFVCAIDAFMHDKEGDVCDNALINQAYNMELI